MSVVDTVHAATVDRYRRLLTRGTTEAAARMSRNPDVAKRLPLLTTTQIDLMADRYALRLAKMRRPLRKADVQPVRPRASDARAYERAMRRGLLRPLMRQLRTGLSTAVATAEAIDRLDQNLQISSRRVRLVDAEVDRQTRRIEGFHRAKLIQTFRAALGVDIRPVLDDFEIRALMDAWRRENVSLIRTIPSRMHEGLLTKMTQQFADAPFDQQALRRLVAQEGQSAGYNLRRITRDQTNKAVSNLSQARHRQLGIEEYVWRTAKDERVRDEHRALNGTTHRWDTPPTVGHPGTPILCRCVPIPVIPEAGIAA